MLDCDILILHPNNMFLNLNYISVWYKDITELTTCVKMGTFADH